MTIHKCCRVCSEPLAACRCPKKRHFDIYWKASELGEAAYLAYHRSLAYRRNKSIRAGFALPELPPEAPEWDSLTQKERSAWAAAGTQIATMVNPVDTESSELPTDESKP